MLRFEVHTGVLVRSQPNQEGNKVMFLSERCEFLWRLALQGGKSR